MGEARLSMLRMSCEDRSAIMSTLAWAIGGWEWVALMAIGLLLFGRRLPEVGRNLGKGIVEFRKGIKGIEDEIESASSPATAPPSVAAAAQPGTQTLEPPAQQTIPHTPAQQAAPSPSAPAAAPAPAQEAPAAAPPTDDDPKNPYRS